MRPFALERYFAQYEFAIEHMLASSDCQPCTVAELYALAGQDPTTLFDVGLGYTPPQGTEALRAAIATHAPGAVDNDIVVAAPQELIHLTLGALAAAAQGPLVVLTPCYQSLTDTPTQHGAEVRTWPLLETDTGWALDLDRLPQLLDGAAGLVVNFPHNPTGYLPSREVFEGLVTTCEERGLWLFSDEMYRGLEADADRLPIAATLYDRAVSLAGLSKAHGLAGLRMGWIIARDEALRDQVLLRKDYSTICAPAPSEAIATVAMGVQDTLWTKHRGRIATNLAALRELVAAHRDVFSWRDTQGGPLAFVRTASSAEGLCGQVRKEGALLLPSSVFDFGDRHVRFGLGRDGFAAGLRAVSRALAA